MRVQELWNNACERNSVCSAADFFVAEMLFVYTYTKLFL